MTLLISLVCVYIMQYLETNKYENNHEFLDSHTILDS